MEFDIAKLEEPLWTIKLPDGGTKDYDPFELQEKLSGVKASAPGPELYDGIRKAFGLPTEAEAKESSTFTFTRHQCLATSAALGDYIDSLPVSKKMSARMKSSDSSV